MCCISAISWKSSAGISTTWTPSQRTKLFQHWQPFFDTLAWIRFPKGTLICRAWENACVIETLHRIQYAVQQGCTRLRNALESTLEATYIHSHYKNRWLKSCWKSLGICCWLLGRGWVPTAGHERKHNACTAEIWGCVSAYTYISIKIALKAFKFVKCRYFMLFSPDLCFPL